MIHWGWLIVAFVLGLLAGYGLLFATARAAGGFLEYLEGKANGGSNEATQAKNR